MALQWLGGATFTSRARREARDIINPEELRRQDWLKKVGLAGSGLRLRRDHGSAECGPPYDSTRRRLWLLEIDDVR